MLGKHKIIIIKPIRGYLGKKIYQVSLIDEIEEIYEVHHEGIVKKIKGKHKIYSYIERKINPRRFIVQQKINLISINKCLMDFRVMVQRRRKSSKWRVTGKFAKIAHREYIITNVAKKILTIEDALKKTSLEKEQIQEAIRTIDWIALTATSCIATVRPKRRILGFDIGIDTKGNVWIIEGNYNPAFFPFKKLKDKSMYKTILKFKYG